MKLNLNRCSIVVVGSWNQAIFVPDRVREKLFGGDAEPQLQIAFTTQGIALRFIGERHVISVAAFQLQILSRLGTEANLCDGDTIGGRLLEWLPETPVTGFGINYGFDVTEPSKGIERILQCGVEDIARLGDDSLLDATLIRRSIRHTDRTINITITRSQTGAVHFDFNHNFACADAREARRKMQNAAEPALAITKQFANDLYGLNVEDSCLDLQSI